jgi:hypothetical protein
MQSIDQEMAPRKMTHGLPRFVLLFLAVASALIAGVDAFAVLIVGLSAEGPARLLLALNLCSPFVLFVLWRRYPQAPAVARIAYVLFSGSLVGGSLLATFLMA